MLTTFNTKLISDYVQTFLICGLCNDSYKSKRERDNSKLISDFFNFFSYKSHYIDYKLKTENPKDPNSNLGQT